MPHSSWSTDFQGDGVFGEDPIFMPGLSVAAHATGNVRLGTVPAKPVPKPPVAAKPPPKPAPAKAGPPAEKRGNTGNLLLGDDTLIPGGYLQALGGPYKLIVAPMQLAIQKLDPTKKIVQSSNVLWSDQTGQHVAGRFIMQKDGNLVLYGKKNEPLWDSRTHGQSGLNAILLDNGILTLRHGQSPVWDTTKPRVQAYTGGMLGHVGDFLGSAVSTAGKAVGTVSGAVGSGLNAIAKVANDIPVVGPAFHGVFSIAAGAFDLPESIAKGERIDRAVLDHFKHQVEGVKEVAPVALAVVTMVPGIGTGVGAVLSAATALAQGQPIGAALIAGVKNAIPGGPLAQAAFSITMDAVQGKNILDSAGQAVLKQLNLPPQAASALTVLGKAVQGQRIDKAVFEEAKKFIPPGPAQKAFDIAVALGQGQKVQSVVTTQVKAQAPQLLNQLAAVGSKAVAASPVYQAGASLLDSAGKAGYQAGIGLMAHSAVSPNVLSTLRNTLNTQQMKGFDMALATKVGQVTRPPTVAPMPPAAASAFFATHGMVGSAPDHKVDMMKTLVSDPTARLGAGIAANQIIADKKADSGFWAWVKRVFGIK